jgi:hypothetical protein
MSRPLSASLLVLVLLASSSARAVDAEATVSAAEPGLSELVTALVRAQLPHQYEKKKNWNQTKEVFDGWHIARDGLRVKTKRKTRKVNHGTWTMYRIDLTQPDQFNIRVSNLRALDDGRAALDAEIATPLALFGRLSEWQYGVQLVSLSADADARVRLNTTLAVRLKLLPGGKLVPDVLLEPEVLSARLTLEEFRLHRLSQLHGPLVKQLGKEAHDVIQDELNDRNAQLVRKMNQQIAKKQDRLRLSLSNLSGSKFGELARFVTGQK